jgi:hypothetical protein
MSLNSSVTVPDGSAMTSAILSRHPNDAQREAA